MIKIKITSNIIIHKYFWMIYSDWIRYFLPWRRSHTTYIKIEFLMHWNTWANTVFGIFYSKQIKWYVSLAWHNANKEHIWMFMIWSIYYCRANAVKWYDFLGLVETCVKSQRIIIACRCQHKHGAYKSFHILL